ncbi:Ig-like domain-containing protein [Microbaculum marinum]|uniref:Ig-like domain-containing protein n=1 Tax=Microbaculum marinum TaxID=1764581 RepID=A0AAW9RGR5_9HYPH
MGAQIRNILIVVAILAVVGAVAVGLRYGLQEPEESATASQEAEQGQRESLAAVPPTDGQRADDAAAPVGKAVPPTFDILRVEPTGDLVAAGRAAGRAHVMLLHGDEELESADANAVGEWAIVLNEPLAPGSYDLLLRATGPDGKGGPVDGDRVTVVIEGPGRTPLVALVRPGEPMQVLQQPKEGTVVVAADAADRSQRNSSDAGGQQAEASAAGNGSAEAEASGAAASQSSAGEPADRPSSGGTPAENQVPSAQRESNPAQGEASEANQPEAPPAAPRSETGVADVSQAGASSDAVAGDAGPGDSEPGRSQVAGGQADGSQVEQAQTGGNQAAPGGDAQTRATESSSGQPGAVVAGSGTAGTSTSAAPGIPQPSPSQQQAADAGGDAGAGAGAQPTAGTGGNVSIKTVEVEDTDKLMLSGEAEPGDAVRLYLNNERLSDVETDADGRWALSSNRAMPPGRYELRADVVGDAGDVKARAEVKFDRVQMVAEDDGTPAGSQNANAAGQGEAGRGEAASGEPSQAAAGGGAAGSVVTIISHAGGSGTAVSGGAIGEGAGTSVVMIARGDSLWRVARKIYGKGVRHSVIYEANKNQIRNPHLIYPGQVFTIPVLEGENG